MNSCDVFSFTQTSSSLIKILIRLSKKEKKKFLYVFFDSLYLCVFPSLQIYLKRRTSDGGYNNNMNSKRSSKKKKKEEILLLRTTLNLYVSAYQSICVYTGERKTIRIFKKEEIFIPFWNG